MAAIISKALEQKRWPMQLWLVVIVLLRKPLDDRAIALMPWIMRLTSKIVAPTSTLGLTPFTATGTRQSEEAAHFNVH